MSQQSIVLRAGAATTMLLCLVLFGCTKGPDGSSASLQSAEQQKAPSDKASISPQEARAEIKQFLEEFRNTFSLGDPDAFERFFAVDAVIWADQRDQIQGWPAIRKMFAGTLEKYFVVEIGHPLELQVYGTDAAFLRILTELTLKPKAGGGPPAERRYREFVMLERINGSWVVTHDLDQPITQEQLTLDMADAQKFADGR